MTTITLEDGKYTVEADGGICHALRNGEPWRSLTGDKLFGAMVNKIDELRAENERLSMGLDDSLDCKNGAGPTALGRVIAERDALRAELDGLKKQEPVAWRWVWKSKPHDIEGWCYTNTPPNHPELQEIEPLHRTAGAQPELEELRADAERYRWLADSEFEIFGSPHMVEYTGKQELDAAIDAARAAS